MRFTFEVGDKVKVKDGLKVGRKYNGLELLEFMNHRGVMTVKVKDGDTFFCDHYWYGEDMLEPAAVMAGITLVDCLCNVSAKSASGNGYAILKALYANVEKEVFYAFIKGLKDAADELLEDMK